ncbi:MAG: glycosyltransferase [Phycisphaerales bacterium]|nr:glycosyltransferase [Phycisphaerales bacterium]
MTTPAVSIVMVNRDRARFVEQAIASVLNQTFRDLELVFWDDGSTDESVAIARRIEALDPRLRVFVGPAQGVVRAHKSAHVHARGEFLGWVDSDDLLGRTALEETAAVLRDRPGVGMVYTGFVVLDEQSRVKGAGTQCRIPYSPTRLLTDFMTFHFRLMRREAFEKAGGIDDSYTTSPDYDLCLRMSEVTTIVPLQRNLYGYRVHGGSISESRRAEQRENSRRMVEAAIRRRGLEGKVRLRVDEQGKFVLEQI